MALRGFSDTAHYLNHLRSDTAEVSVLQERLSVVVSHFFRNPLVFEYLLARIIPEIIQSKALQGDRTLRIWSAGCAAGEEAYSVAIVCLEAIRRHADSLKVNIIATDIDSEALKTGSAGVFVAESVANTRFSFLNQYFVREGARYVVSPEVKKVVHFSKYDLFDQFTYAPPESMFGDFDIVLCRNVLIYYDYQHQLRLLRKLSRATVVNGFLILGEAESLPPSLQEGYLSEPDGFHIYRKVRKLRQG